MKIKVWLSILIALLVLTASSHAFAAKPEGVGKGRSAEAKSAAQRVGDEIADSVADVLTGEEGKKSKGTKTGDLPPGLAKKGKVPPGLAKQDKIPPGWNKGEKKGWGEREGEADESPIKRFFKNLLSKQQAE